MKKRKADEIIDFILNDLGIKAPTFASKINMPYTRIHDIQKGRTKKISGEVANCITSNYPQYNFSWLISGEGEIYNGTLTERLDKYRMHKNIELDEFLNSINMPSFRYALIMPSNIRKEEQDIILDKYPDLNLDWLIEGKGDMLKSDKQTKVYEVSPIAEEDYMMVEYEDLQASAGYLGTGDISQLSDKKKRLVPKEYKNGKFLVVRVDGDSMDDNSKRSLSNGDEILIYLNQDLKIDQLPIRKTLFVITTHNGNVVKQIAEINNDEQYIVCRSFNPSYEDYKVNFEDILQIFTVCKVVNRQISF